MPEGGLPPISASPQQLATLVKQAQRGSSQAFTQIYELYFDRAYYTARKVVRDAHIAEEIVQEAFLRVLTKIDTLREPEKFNSWFFSIVYYEATHYLRDNRKASQTESLDALEDYDSATPEVFNAEFLPQQALAAKEDRDLLLNLIDKLTVAQRLTVVLYYYNELSIPQIAEALGVSSSAVSKRLFDARTTLKAGFTQAARNTTAPVSADQKPLVLTRLMSDEARGEETSAAKERTTAWIAGCLPTLLVSQMSNPALAARAEAFLGSNQPKPATKASPSHTVPLAAKIACGVAALALVTGGGVYALYHQIVSARSAATRQSTNLPSPASPTATTPATKTSVTTPASTDATPASTPALKPAPTPKPAAPKPTPAPAPAPAPASVRPVISAVQLTLTYPPGTPVPAAKIIADAGASACDAKGSTLSVTLSSLATVDFNNPGIYQVYLHATDSVGLSAKTKILTIIVQ